MLTNKTTYRVIYGDTDNMGMAYHANYFRWFEIGRGEMLRSLGIPYKTIEEKGIFIVVSEVRCKYFAPVRYDDIVTIQTSFDPALKGGLKFDFLLFTDRSEKPCATGWTKHACVDRNGQLVRPPEFITKLLRHHDS
jgi:acyl-CoA thioester hydrolase